MAQLEPVSWPSAPIRTERLVLRESEARDRAALIELLASAEVRGPTSAVLDRVLSLNAWRRRCPAGYPGLFVVDLDGEAIGTVQLERREAQRPGHVRPDGGEIELGYVFLPHAWGLGYAAEACAAALGWCADVFPGEPVVLTTQTANDRSMRLAAKLGFTEVERFEEFGAEQWFGVRWPVTPPARDHGCCHN